MIMISKALRSFYPNAEFIIEDENIDKIQWIKNKPAEFEFTNENEKQDLLNRLIAETNRLDLVEEQLAYQRKRKLEYPPITDYLDGIVKGDTEQVQAYIDACLAVKAKYPKPE